MRKFYAAFSTVSAIPASWIPKIYTTDVLLATTDLSTLDRLSSRPCPFLTKSLTLWIMCWSQAIINNRTPSLGHLTVWSVIDNNRSHPETGRRSPNMVGLHLLSNIIGTTRRASRLLCAFRSFSDHRETRDTSLDLLFSHFSNSLSVSAPSLTFLCIL